MPLVTGLSMEEVSWIMISDWLPPFATAVPRREGLFSMTYKMVDRVRLTRVRGQMSAVLVAFLAVTCGGERAIPPATESTASETARAPLPPPPPVDDAARIVSGSPEFSDYQFTRAAFTMPIKEQAMTPAVRETSRALAKAGWIGVDGDGNLVLTDRAKNDKRFLVRQNGFIDIVPMAKKEFIGVEAVHVNPEGQPLVDFRWRWVPNEIGALAADRYSGEQLAIATLLWDGSQWSVLRITPRT
jgi:hypothetical protein